MARKRALSNFHFDSMTLTTTVLVNMILSLSNLDKGNGSKLVNRDVLNKDVLVVLIRC